MMADAPERIWTWIDYDGNWDGTWLSDSKALQPERLPDAQYVHRDLYDAQAARIAELEGVLEIAERALHEHDTADYGWDEENPWTMGEWFDESDRAKIAAAVTALKGTDNG